MIYMASEALYLLAKSIEFTHITHTPVHSPLDKSLTRRFPLPLARRKHKDNLERKDHQPRASTERATSFMMLDGIQDRGGMHLYAFVVYIWSLLSGCEVMQRNDGGSVVH